MKVDDEAMIAIINISSLTGGGVACLRVPVCDSSDRYCMNWEHDV